MPGSTTPKGWKSALEELNGKDLEKLRQDIRTTSTASSRYTVNKAKDKSRDILNEMNSKEKLELIKKLGLGA